jgi:hypothetical protein
MISDDPEDLRVVGAQKSVVMINVGNRIKCVPRGLGIQFPLDFS